MLVAYPCFSWGRLFSSAYKQGLSPVVEVAWRILLSLFRFRIDVSVLSRIDAGI